MKPSITNQMGDETSQVGEWRPTASFQLQVDIKIMSWKLLAHSVLERLRSLRGHLPTGGGGCGLHRGYSVLSGP